MRVFLILVLVSQHALAAKVEVYEGAESVLLPCRVSFLLEDTTVTWSHPDPDLNHTTIHRRHEDQDDLEGQNQRYSGRTSMRANEADSEDLSLTLSKPQLSDGGSYACIISKQKEQLTLTNVQLEVKVDMLEVEAKEGSEFVELPCQTASPLPDDTTVEWSRSDPIPMIVHVFPNSSSELLKKQDEFFCGRTRMQEDSLKTGDLSLSLKYPSERDNGHYICTVHTGTDVLRQKVVLFYVKGQLQAWATALLSIMAISLVLGGGFAAYFWYYYKMVFTVEVDEGVESVELPFRTTPNLPNNSTVEWTCFSHGLKSKTVHVYSNGKEQPGETYNDRTKMNEDPLTSGDLSLTLRKPRSRDNGIYICIISRRKLVLNQKRLRLNIRVPQVKVSEGAECAVLPWKTLFPPPEKATIEWSRHEPWPMMVHVHQSGSSCLEKQTWFYRGRTNMEEDPRKTRNLSLVLNQPMVLDSGEYICTIKEDGRIVKRKSLRLCVRDFNHVSDDEAEEEKSPLIQYSMLQPV